VNRHLGPDVAELIGDTDPHRVADALVSMLTNPGRRERMGNAGRVLVGERYSFDRLAHLLVRLMSGEDVRGDTVEPRRRA
jgi:glycosyltransferase involved in cell wall biosynthesis